MERASFPEPPVAFLSGTVTWAETVGGWPEAFGINGLLPDLFGLKSVYFRLNALLWPKSNPRGHDPRGRSCFAPGFSHHGFPLSVVPNFVGGDVLLENLPHIFIDNNVVIINLQNVGWGLGEGQHGGNPSPSGRIQSQRFPKVNLDWPPLSGNPSIISHRSSRFPFTQDSKILGSPPPVVRITLGMIDKNRVFPNSELYNTLPFIVDPVDVEKLRDRHLGL